MKCPRCGREHNLLLRYIGDVLHCRCGFWLLVCPHVRGVRLVSIGKGLPLFPAVNLAQVVERHARRVRFIRVRKRRV